MSNLVIVVKIFKYLNKNLSPEHFINMISEIEVISLLNKAKTAREVLCIYEDYFDFFKKNEGSIILSDKTYQKGNLIFNDMFSGYEKYCKSLFKSNNFVFFNPDIVEKYGKGSCANIKIDWSVSYDSNFARLIQDIITIRNFNKYKQKYENLENLLKLLLNENKNVQQDFILYVIENIYKENTDKSHILKNIEAVLKFFNLNVNSAEEISDMSVSSQIKLTDDIQNAKQLIDDTLDDSSFKNELQKMYKLYYLVLLKMVYLNKKLKSEKQKIKALVEFMHNELYAITLRELSIAIEYFKEGKKDSGENKPSFFNKVNSDIGKNLLEYIKNMAWDFTLVRFLELIFISKPNEDADFFIPFFLTLDKGLSEIIDFYPLRSIVYFKKLNSIHPIPENDIDVVIEKNRLDEYFNSDAILERENKRQSVNDLMKHLNDLIECAEQKILSI